ncbi:MAG: helix-turn-helix domain-containing protein [bacterium]
MSPRPRTASDTEIFAATARAVSRVGPGRLTLADVAGDVGLTPAALIRRFGSKRSLLLAFVNHGPSMVEDCFVTVRAAHASPLAALIAAAANMADHVRSPDELVNSLTFLQIDLTDSEFRRPALEHSKQVLAGYEALIRDAVDAGELMACNVTAVARAVQAVTGGSLITWAIHREGVAGQFVRRDLETILAPLCGRAARPRKRTRRPRAR